MKQRDTLFHCKIQVNAFNGAPDLAAIGKRANAELVNGL